MTLLASRGAAGTIVLGGDLDLANAGELREAIDHADVHVLDMSGVEFLGAAALRVLTEIQRRRRVEGSDLRITAPSRAVVRTLQVAGLLCEFVSPQDR